MANWNRWGIAAGLAGALAIFGTAAQAQGVGTGGTKAGGDPSELGSSTKQGSSGSSSESGSSGTASSSSASGKVDQKLQEDVQRIHAANQAEVHMGQMGQQQATSPEVKQFAEKLEQDHQKLDDQLTQTAQSAGIQLEGKGYLAEQKDAQKSMHKLEGKTGPDFDKAFVSMMVKDHERDIKETQKAAKEAKKQNQTELAALLDQAVTGMQGHLDLAKQLEKTAGKGKGARGASSSSTGSGSSGSGSSSTSDMNGGSSSMGTGAGVRQPDAATGATDSQHGTTGGASSTHDTGNTGDTSQTKSKTGSGQ